MGRQGKRPTIVDIARAAGVSVSTVSRVLNGKQDVAQQTRDAIHALMQAAGYTVNPAARSLVGAPTRLIGIYIRYLPQEFSIGLLTGIIGACERAGYGTVFFAGENCLSSPGAPLLSTLPDALLVVSPGFDEQPAINSILDRSRPVVFVEPLDTDPNGVVVTVTNREGQADITRYLVGLGHRRIGYVAGPSTMPSSRQRLQGFCDALLQAGIPIDPDLIVEGNFTQRGGYEAAKRLLQLSPPPTAIVAANDFEAFGVLQAVREAQLRVPEEISVTGFDDVPSAEYTHPPLTTVHQPLAEMGMKAVQLLLQWLEGQPPEPGPVVLSTQLVIRGSCGPPMDLRMG